MELRMVLNACRHGKNLPRSVILSRSKTQMAFSNSSLLKFFAILEKRLFASLQ